MNDKFKAGDKVRCIDVTNATRVLFLYVGYEVKHVMTETSLIELVETSGFYRADRFELVATAPIQQTPQYFIFLPSLDLDPEGSYFKYTDIAAWKEEIRILSNDSVKFEAGTYILAEIKKTVKVEIII